MMTRGIPDQIGNAELSNGPVTTKRFDWTVDMPGVQRVEWHEAPEPDGAFRRLPVPGLVIILTLATRGEWRRDSNAEWRAQPAASVRGLTLQPTDGRDPTVGELHYASLVIAPWAAPMYLGVPASVFSNDIVDIATLKGGAWGLVLEQLALRTSPDERRAVLVRALQHFQRPLDGESYRPRTMHRLLSTGRAVSAVAAALGISTRRLHQLSLEHFGVTPSVISQLSRFARGIDALQPHASFTAMPDWHAEHADQAHAIKAFRRLAGVTPRRYAVLQRASGRTQFTVPVS